MAIYRVPTHLVNDIWSAVETDVERACEYHPFMDAGDILALLSRSMGTLFIATESGQIVGFGVVEVVQYPSRCVANILCAGGRYGFLAVAINELLPFMIAHGKDQGATVVTLSGRPGWLRALRHLGGRSQRFITWWADIDEQGRRNDKDHEHSVGTGTAVHY